MKSSEQKLYRLIANTDSIRKININQYSVDSQTDSMKSYLVQRIPKTDIWTCSCLNFLYRLQTSLSKHCKHITACILLQDRLECRSSIKKIKLPKICQRCDCDIIVKNGYRRVKNGIKRQRYRCKKCNYKFILGEKGFSRVGTEPKYISESLNLVMCGVSYRNVSRHLFATYEVEISHSTIAHWIQKYTQIIYDYVSSLNHELSDVWSMDEMVLNVKNTIRTEKGFSVWLWSIIDPKTRFVIVSEVSKRREIRDARHVITKAKTYTRKPSYIITDSLQAYKDAIKKEFSNKTAHIKTNAFKDGFINRPIERYHNEIRENVKTRRGIGNDDSSQIFSKLLQINHNFVKPHSGLNGDTPAKAAKINLDLGPDKYRDLINLSFENNSSRK